MQIPQGQLGLVNIDRKVTSTPPREVLDITIPPVFPRRDGPSSFRGDLFEDFWCDLGGRRGTDVCAFCKGKVRFRAGFVEVGGFQGGLSGVPGVEEFLRGGCAAVRKRIRHGQPMLLPRRVLRTHIKPG